ncbi:MAG TPA: hypothetical protein VMR52_04100 [Dehalococcoidia bacterium]|nr:hypothetical protein [Dehalococcoidia bacterium]
MPNFPRRARMDIALMLRCCSHCLGDLEFRSELSGDYYVCLQCNQRAETSQSKIGRLARLGGDVAARPRPTAS